MTVSEREWEGAPIRLDRALPELGLARSRSQAAEFISSGRVSINGVVTLKAGTKVLTGGSVSVSGTDHYVSRGAHKLLAGLNAFDVHPAGRLALDLGASTGGFTQVLLERGARRVLAVDVGHDQMVAEISGDERVHLVEGCNARELTADRLTELTGVDERPDLVVADLSFISLSLIFPAIARTAAEHAELVMLIKPQFEVGRGGIRDGIVVDPALRTTAVQSVIAAARENGYLTVGLDRSPIAGGHGNQEFLAHFVPESRGDQTQWDGDIGALSSGNAA